MASELETDAITDMNINNAPAPMIPWLTEDANQKNLYPETITTSPRKILAYRTPDEIFERELDHIYQAA